MYVSLCITDRKFIKSELILYESHISQNDVVAETQFANKQINICDIRNRTLCAVTSAMTLAIST